MMKIFLSMLLIGVFFTGFARDGIQIGYSLDAELKTRMVINTSENFESGYLENVFLKSIQYKDGDLKKRYVYCLNELKNYKNLESTCRDLYHESIKKCFIYDSNISCGILRNISILYDNRDMVRKVDKKIKNNSNIFIENQKLLNIDDVSILNVFIESSIVTNDFLNFKPSLSISIGGTPSMESPSSFPKYINEPSDERDFYNFIKEHADFFAWTWSPKSASGISGNRKLDGVKMSSVYFGKKDFFNNKLGLYGSLDRSIPTTDESKLDKNELKYFYTIFNIGLLYSISSDFLLLGGVGCSIESDELKYRGEDKYNCDGFGNCYEESIYNYDYVSKEVHYRINFNAEIAYFIEDHYGLIFGYNSAPEALNIGAFIVF